MTTTIVPPSTESKSATEQSTAPAQTVDAESTSVNASAETAKPIGNEPGERTNNSANVIPLPTPEERGSRQVRRANKRSKKKSASKAAAEGDQKEDDKPRKASQAKILLGFIDECKIELFHSNREAFARAPLANGGKATYAIRSRDMRSFLNAKYYGKTGEGARSQSMSDAINAIEARALHDPASRETQVHLRIAHAANEIYLDLGDDKWNGIHITPNGWEVRPHDVCFRRMPGMEALPTPQHGGSLDLLRKHINLSDKKQDETWSLVASWLVAAIATLGPYALLALIAEQGAGKSVIARILRSLLDPSAVPLVGTPRQYRDLLIAANASHVLVIDNLSHIPGELSDCLCCISTGIGYRARTLFTDCDETIISVRRAIILTAITNVIHRGDLADRAVTVPLFLISEESHRDEAEIWAAFEQDRPLILGALLDAVVLVLANRNKVRRSITYKPRMHDYAIAAVSAESAYGVEAGTWERAHRAMRGEAQAAEMEAPFAIALTKFLDEQGGAWSGDATSFLTPLNAPYRLSGERPPQGWPIDATRLASALRRMAPAARACGIEINIDKSKKDPVTRRQIIEINRSVPAKQPSEASEPSFEAETSKPKPNFRSLAKADRSLIEHAKAAKTDFHTTDITRVAIDDETELCIR